MQKLERTSFLALAAAFTMGVAAGIFLQFWQSSRGHSTLVPPISLSVTMLMIGGVLLVLGVRLSRAIVKRPGVIDPFHAVRLLAAARAGQFVGAVFGGLGAGLALALLERSVPASASTWLPMVYVFGAGTVLVICAAVTETLCRVPPGNDAANGHRSRDGETGSADQPAFRKP
jgi:hypothetical protein